MSEQFAVKLSVVERLGTIDGQPSRGLEDLTYEAKVSFDIATRDELLADHPLRHDAVSSIQ